MKKVVNVEKTDSKFEDYILFDIETTGLHRSKDFMYMFGVCEKIKDELIFSQYYIEDEKNEKELILKINDILKDRDIISYNGDRFDFPFIRKKAMKYSIDLVNFKNEDIYREFQKLNFFLREKSLKAINLGKRLGLEVHDHVNQEEMPQIFKMYCKVKDKENLFKLIYHNYIDLKVLSSLYEYKVGILDEILKIKNRNFTGKIFNLYLQNENIVVKLKNLSGRALEFNDINYSIIADEKQIVIRLEVRDAILKDKTKGKFFKLNGYKNTVFKETNDLREDVVLLMKGDVLIRENLLLLLNVL